MLLAGPDRHEEARIARENVPHLIRREPLQPEGAVARHLVIAGIVVAVGATEWLRGGAPAWTYATALVAVGLVLRAALAPSRRAVEWGLAAAAILVAAGMARTVRDAGAIRCCWPAEREARLTRASRQLSRELGAAVADARALADRAAAAATLPPDEVFDRLAAAVRQGTPGVERGVALVAADGTPIAWAGRHRTLPVPDTAELRASISPFYVTLEARRQAPAAGAVAVGTVLLDAGPAIPDGDGAVARRFADAYGVDLRFYASRTAPHDSDVFDFCPSGCDAGDTLFSVEPLPPVRAEALATIHREGQRGVVVGLLALLLLLLLAAPVGLWRWATLAAAVGTLTRVPLVPALMGTGPSPPTLARSLLGFASGSTVALGVVSATVLIAAAALWRRGLPRRWFTLWPAGLLLLAAPYLVRYFGRGIRPPVSGVSLPLWLSWEVVLAAVAMALVLLAAALVRGPEEPRGVPWTLPVACGWAILAAAAGLWLWRPYDAWPEWYTFLWLPALAGAIVPARRRATLIAVATVAGTAAALVTWGAAVEGRLSLAQRDVGGLGEVVDPAVAPALDSLATVTDTVHAPQSPGALYALWHGTSLAARGYPAVLALWSSGGQLEAELRLAALDLPDPLLAALVRRPGAPTVPRVERLARIPGVHEVLVAPLLSGEWLTVGVGPRSLLIESDRVTRFLRGEGRVAAPYTLTLSAPNLSSGATQRFAWDREGWSVRGERRFDFADGVRHVHAVVDLGGAPGLLVRGALAVLVDLVFLAALVAAGGLFLHRPPRHGPSPLTRFRESYRVRLAAVLVAFFVVPVLASGVWGFTDLSEDAAFAGDLLITQTLRDAIRSAEQVPFDRPGAAGAVHDLGLRLDAGLWAYRGGALVGTSEPVLGDLGLVDPLLEPDIFRRVALRDQIETTATIQAAGRTVRVGYRVVVNGGSGGEVVLAAPQLIDDARVRVQERELALDLALAAIAGLVAAAGLAGLAARRLERPVALLREAAVAVGKGGTPPAFPEAPPVEFAPVLSAFQRMVVDVRRSQTALEEARARTAQVLATVATGVLAVDAGLRVTLLNPRAVELLGAPVAPGDELPEATGAEWAGVWEDVVRFIAASEDTIAEREVEVGPRRVRVQIALLGPAPDGCVIALDDTTALGRAARVLAWGQMARQVAHEIKNPLTPVRLGIQHLQRVWQSDPAHFDRTLADTARRILTEIDRLDAIARGFARFGAPGADAAPLEAVDLLAVARDVLSLYALGESAGTVTVAGPATGAPVPARRDEVREVLLNLLENARDAGARHIEVEVKEGGRGLVVRDDGRGIPADVLPRVFEPTFSTTSSGSGLGLAIARRLVEGWGATIGLESAPGAGTTVTVTFPAAAG